MALTAKQQAFVAYYLVDLNARQAALKAGYSKRNPTAIGYHTLNKPEVAAAIKAGMAERLERLKMSADEVVVRFSRISRTTMADVLAWGTREVEYGYDKDGMLLPPERLAEAAVTQRARETYVTPRNSDELSEDALEAVSEVTLTKDGGFKIKLHDKNAALDKLARYRRLYSEDGGDGVRFTLVIESPHDVVARRRGEG